MAKPERVAFLGLGIMGAPMAANLVKAGFEVIVWNRTQARATDFAGRYGAHPAPTPAAAAEAADVTITMVPDGPQVEEVLFGDNGAAGHDRERAVLGPRARTGDRCVEELDPLLAQLLADPHAGARGDRGHVDDQAAAAHALGAAAVAEQHLLDLGAVRDHRDEDVRVGGRLGRGVGDARSVLGGELIGAGAGPVPDGQVVARPDEVRGHRCAHDPQPEEGHPLMFRHVRHLRGSRS